MNDSLDDDERRQHLDMLRQAARSGSERLADIAEVALALAALDQPGVDLAAYRDHLKDLAAATAGAAAGSDRPQARAQAIRAGVYKTFGYSGDGETYDDMQNANLMRVIDRRKGLPVALGILVMHAARAQGWPIVGINFPSHFLLKLQTAGGGIIIDPFRGAEVMEASDLRKLLKSMAGADAELSPEFTVAVDDRGILARLQNNIKLRALGAGDLGRAGEVLETMTLLIPEEASLVLELAAIQAELGSLGAASARLRALIDANPSGAYPEAEHLLETLQRRLN